MDISFYCKQCGQHILIEDSAVGAAVNCPSCDAQIIVPAQSDQTKVTSTTKPDTKAAGSGKRKTKPKKVIITILLVLGLFLVLFFGRSVTRKDRSPFGKNEQQVDRLYGEPVKVEKDERTYLLGDIIAEVRFFHYKGNSEVTSVSFHKDSPVPLVPNRITLQETQRLLKEISGGGRWTIEQDDSKHHKYGETHYVYREESWRLIYRKLSHVPVKEFNATYHEDYGMLFVFGNTFGTEFSIRDAFATEPPPHPLSSNELAAMEAEMKAAETNIAPVEEKPTVLDLKGGFREYRLGMKRSEIAGDLTKEHSFSEDADEYGVENFNRSMGTFEIDNIKLEFDRRLGILKEIRVWVKGKQNVQGVLEALKIAYGEPERGGLGDREYSWLGTDIELRYSTEEFFDTTATATWISKRIYRLIQDDRTRRAKEGATDAAKGL